MIKGIALRENESYGGMDEDERFVNQKVGPLTRCDVRKTAARGDNTKARYAFATSVYVRRRTIERDSTRLANSDRLCSLRGCRSKCERVKKRNLTVGSVWTSPSPPSLPSLFTSIVLSR